MADEKKPNTFKDKATILKAGRAVKVVKPVERNPDLIDIRRTRSDGIELNRQCHKADLPEFVRRGFKPVAPVKPIGPNKPDDDKGEDDKE